MSHIVKRGIVPILVFILVFGNVTSVIGTESEEPALELVYSSFFGGTDDDLVHAMAVDSEDNIIIAGVTSSANLPTYYPYQALYGGSGDSFIAKFSADGQDLIFASYIGGTDLDILSHVAVDSNDNIVVSGFTYSSDFPVFNSLHDQINGSDDIFLMKFSPNGTIQFSTYLGGSGGEIARALVFDSEDNIIFGGHTSSSDFPVSENANQTDFGGLDDAVIVHFSSDGQEVLHATYLGGSLTDGINHAYLNDQNQYIMCGLTDSENFPTSPDAFQVNATGGFVTVFDVDDEEISYSSYLGGNGSDYLWRITPRIESGFIISGYTDSQDFPITPNANQTSLAGGRDGFITAFNDDMTLNFSTYIGGTDDDEVRYAIEHFDGNIVCVGITDSGDFPVSAHASQPTKDSVTDAFVGFFDPHDQKMCYSTFLGGNSYDYAWGVALTSNSTIILTGSTGSTNFPVLNAYQDNMAGVYDAVVCKYSILTPHITTAPTTSTQTSTISTSTTTSTTSTSTTATPSVPTQDSFLLTLVAISSIGITTLILVVLVLRRR